MTTTNERVLATRSRGQEQAINGVHADVIVVEAPAAASIYGSAAYVIDKPLRGLTLTIDGDYHCLIPTRGLAGSLAVHTTVTLNSMTASTALDALTVAFDPRTVNVADAVILTGGASDGALTTTTEQIATLTPAGANYARFTLTIAGTPTSVVVTQCEVVSL